MKGGVRILGRSIKSIHFVHFENANFLRVFSRRWRQDRLIIRCTPNSWPSPCIELNSVHESGRRMSIAQKFIHFFFESFR